MGERARVSGAEVKLTERELTPKKDGSLQYTQKKNKSINYKNKQQQQQQQLHLARISSSRISIGLSTQILQ